MISKKIHYCWFGKKKKPKSVHACINSWRKFMPDYELVEWNEDNFDLESNSFVSQAYRDKNYAFVSDYVRGYALYLYGGIYLDTDVESLKSFDRFLENDFFAGFEFADYVGSCVIGSVAGHPIIKKYLEYYDSVSYIKANGEKHSQTSVSLLTNLLEEYGFKLDGERQAVKGAVLYPRSYFSPFDYVNITYDLSEDSHAVHHFAQSWLPLRARLKTKGKHLANKLFGQGFVKRMRELK